MKIKHSIIMAFMGLQKDRFCDYQESCSPDEKMRMVSQVKGISGVEIVYPFECEDTHATKQLLEKYGLDVSAVNVNIKAAPDQFSGSSSVPNKKIRDNAIQLIQEAMDKAAALGTDRVTCCPLSDGYDYLFQTDYLESWKNMVTTFKEAAVYRKDIQLFLEYKGQETRANCFMDTASKTICLIRDINEPNLGITLDFGHSIMANETPAEALSLIHGSGIPYYVHTNDNNRRWDWDLIPATRNLWDYLEFFLYLKKFNYEGWLTSDMSPIRLDRVKAFEQNVLSTEKVIELVHRLDSEKLFSQMRNGQTLEILQYLRDSILQ